MLNMLSAALTEVKALLKARKALAEGTVHDVVQELQWMQQVLGQRMQHQQYGASGMQHNSALRSPKFQRVMECLQKATRDAQYLERRHPKIAVLKEILAEHFARHQRVGSSTRALVFSQLRTTVHEIKSELADVTGASIAIVDAAVSYSICPYSRCYGHQSHRWHSSYLILMRCRYKAT